MTRYLVALSPTPGIGGFTYADHRKALESWRDARRRWPRAELRVLPPRPLAQHRIACAGKPTRETLKQRP